MTFFALGLNHETASVDVTETFALDEAAQRRVYAALELGPSAEVILLSTCNRTEAYLYGTEDDVARVQEQLSEKADRPWRAEEAFLLRDEAAVRHVMEVTSGLRSMVLGDDQILAQVKDAYRHAVEVDAVDTLLHRLMHTSFRAAKRVSNETSLSSGPASVSSAAVAMARDHFSDVIGSSLEGTEVLLVGVGKMGQLALQALQNYRPRTMRVTNRSPERARDVADTHGAEVVPWDDRYAAASTADVVIVATSASEAVLRAEHLPPRSDHRVPALVIDISMPRTVDPAIDERSGYAVHDFDSLRTWTDRAEAQRTAEVPKARAICDELLSDFVTWVFHQQALQPAIQAIRETFESIRMQEIDRHAHRFSDSDKQELDEITQSIMQKLLAVPIVRLKNVDPESIDFVRGIELLRILFQRPGCEDGSAEAIAGSSSEADSVSRPSLSDVPEACPFGEADEQGAPLDEEDVLRRVLRAPSSASSDEA